MTEAEQIPNEESLVAPTVDITIAAIASNESNLKFVGICLAAGCSHSETVDRLRAEERVKSEEEALAVIKTVYDGWHRVDQDLKFDAHDPLSYHLMMRHELLKTTMCDPGTARTALAILESLAELEGVERKPPEERVQSIRIELVPKLSTSHASETAHESLDDTDTDVDT